MVSIKSVVSLCLLLAVAGCASNKKIIVDQQGVDPATYQQDLAECEAVASQVQGGQGVKNAAAGAAMGGAIGAIRDDSDQAKEDAGVGAVLGLAHGRRDMNQERLQVQKNCLRNRGYQVLN